MSKNSPHPVDLHVGNAIRNRRQAVGISMQTLAERVGLTYQQVAKYELAQNRCSASMMWTICRALGIEVATLFEGFRERTPERRARSGRGVARTAA